MSKEQAIKPTSFLELKIVSNTLSELERLIKNYEKLGFISDGTSIDNGKVYVAFLAQNNGLITINE